MKIVVPLQGNTNFITEVDDIADIETSVAHLYPDGIPSDIQTAINAAYGTQQTRAQNKTDFQGWMDDVNTAIANTENDLPAPTLANLATITAIVNELNAIRRRQNRIMKAIRYIARLLVRDGVTALRR